MTPAFQLYNFISGKYSIHGDHPIKNLMVSTLEEIHNDYCKDELPIIPINTVMQLDFGGDFGIYALADINGTLHKVKIPLNEISHIDWAPHEEEIAAYSKPSAEHLKWLEEEKERISHRSMRDYY